jgi:WhiB family redox-sensing transcriptional regulator
MTELEEELDISNAACNDADPAIFWPVPPKSGTWEAYREDIATAKSYCDICPIVAQCLAYAIANDCDGIWGGTMPAERKALVINMQKAPSN